MAKSASTYWIYGLHAAQAALDNKHRQIHRILATSGAAEKLNVGKHRPEIVTHDEISSKCGSESVHQGVALSVVTLDEQYLEEVTHHPYLVILDQVTDPHNVGAIMRSAAAFGVGAVIVPKDHAPQETGVMAKAACGALETVPLVRVTNLAKAMKDLKAKDYWLLGMDGTAKAPVSAAKDYEKCVIVMGAEGKGLRRLTAENCDLLIKIPICEAMESLNVSNAAAIAFYSLS